MSLGIRSKLAIAIAAIAVLITILVFIAMLFSFRIGFLHYVNSGRMAALDVVHEALDKDINSQARWQHLRGERRQWEYIIKAGLRAQFEHLFESGKRPKRMPRHQRPPRPNDFYLLDKQKNALFGRPENNQRPLLKPIFVDDKKVGYIGVRRLVAFSHDADKRFVAQQTRYFIVIALLAGALGLLSAFWLAKWLVSPVQGLNRAMNRLMQKEYETRVSVGSKDEIGELTQSFNHLAETLAEHEKSQQQWIADISHELRTPLATLRGEIEAIQDGVRQLSPEGIDSLHEEILHIQRIVDDLHQLALSDLGALRYRFEHCDISQTIARLEAHFSNQLEQKSLQLSLKVIEPIPNILADDDRLYQCFANLLQNSLRYTDQGGEIRLQLFSDKLNQTVTLSWEDSKPGVETEALDKLFNRLYREESSRNRAQGGSGLGLSIVKSIIQAHQGTIQAEHSALGGLKFIISFPIAK